MWSLSENLIRASAGGFAEFAAPDSFNESRYDSRHSPGLHLRRILRPLASNRFSDRLLTNVIHSTKNRAPAANGYLRPLLAAALAIGIAWGETLMASEPRPEEEGATNGVQPPNVSAKTMGGKQFWADEMVFRGYRVQRNALTGHYRLLDPDDRRLSWGTFRHCRTRLDEIRRDRDLPAMEGKVVILLHGLFRTRGSMNALAKHLKEKGGYETLDVGYPSVF